LERAIRTESSAAIQYHFGVSAGVVHDWRRQFGVGQWGTDGSKRLHKLSSDRGADAARGHGRDLTREERKRRSNRGKATAEGKWACGNPEYSPWTPEDLALFEAGRTGNAVRAMRDRRRRAGHP
jgi:hypothetical protein